MDLQKKKNPVRQNSLLKSTKMKVQFPNLSSLPEQIEPGLAADSKESTE